MITRGAVLVWIGILALSGMFLMGQDDWTTREREACCFDDGSCGFVYPADCAIQNGNLQGPGTDCSNVTCPAPEACCMDDGSCQDLLPADCPGHPQGLGTDCATVGGQCPPPQLVFITAGTHDGNLGGLEGADAICQEEADAEGLPGKYKAWLSDTTTNAIDRLTPGGPYFKVDGVKVANDMADIVDCSNPECLQSPIDVTPDAVQLTGDVPWAENVWTSTGTAGVYAPVTLFPEWDACDDWTLGAGEGSIIGMVGVVPLFGYEEPPIDVGWTNMGAYISTCVAPNRLYCFQQWPECALPEDCDDGNPCTDDDCVDNACVNTNNTDPCDDSDACTEADTCSEGVCSGDPVDCGDHGECVDGLCECTDNYTGDYCEIPPKIVFITAPTPSGNLGGLAGADAICQAEADTEGLPGTYKAWLSASGAGNSAIDRLAHGGPYYKVNGVKVADDMADIIDCGNPQCLQSAIDVTSDGVQITGTPPWAVFVWTATKADGIYNATPGACGDWTLTTGASLPGMVGEFFGISGGPIDGNWTNTGSIQSACTAPNRLYCFQQ